MCEYCGCQEIEVIGELTREHDAVVALISQIQSSLTGERLDEVVTGCHQISAILAPHTVVEEEGLFPEMAAEFPDHVDALRSEHRKIESVLDEATDGIPADATWPDRLLGVLFLLREHILKEQDGVFPAALIALDADQWERIEAVRARLVEASTTLIPATLAPATLTPATLAPATLAPKTLTPETLATDERDRV